MDSTNINFNPAQTQIQNSSTVNALGRAAKCFGRNVCKMAVAVPYVLYHVLSIGTEALCGAGGAVVGAVRGGTVKLARAIGAKLDLCEKSTRPLSDYVIKDFHRGANIGWLPGQIIGVVGSAVTSAGILLSPVSLGIGGTYIVAYSLVEGVVTYNEVKETGHSSAEQKSKNIFRDMRRKYRDKHDWLYGNKRL